MAALIRSAPWLMFGGNATLLVGLAWDARLHALDPTLAAREGVFTMSNPGHALFGGGVALLVAGSILLLLGQAGYRSGVSAARRVVAVAASAALVALSAFALTAAMSGQEAHGAQGAAHGTAAMADGSGHEEHHGSSPAPAASPAPGPTPEQRAAAAKLLADIRRASPAYGDLAAAAVLGYVQSTPWAMGAWGPAHFVHRVYSRDGRHLDPERPESLVFMRLPAGRVAFLGVMFSAPKGLGPRPGGPLTEWHTHDNICLTAVGQVVMTTAPGQCPPGAFFVGEKREMMHVWTFDHPDGPFAPSLTPAAIRAAVRQFGGR